MSIEQGDALPKHALVAADGSAIALPEWGAGAPFVLYFYPKDDTSGCTREAQDFTALMPEFEGLGVKLLGISKDPPAKHQKFTAKYDLAVPLATDEDGALMEALGVWVEKSMYGKKYMGIERSTFLFDAAGTLVRAWRKVKVPGHAAEVLDAAKGLG
ncbi:peroxiredoxin [Sphingomonas sp. ABOLD]|uniref:thioredoxin-dependent peroxiredoxin n=1 Tax=Sphingomonas trueperi TaxID=53317 RepID=A0A7X5XZL1_9SPHN|nr:MULTISPECIES: peroxiredoxin [Sphingomonas]NJB97885.1 peroxiredoxin Q/BCP [Sphingomonas trueperi]RSV40228.1 peroxiredoxin [Sphingomonas sp. ABOLD]RSV41481.1 peroxiredoxin [Sphingomonas sp. ABOLE]